MNVCTRETDQHDECQGLRGPPALYMSWCDPFGIAESDHNSWVQTGCVVGLSQGSTMAERPKAGTGDARRGEEGI